MATVARTYWLTTACRIARKDQSLVIERADGTAVHIPVTDVRDIVACAPADLNTAVIGLLNTYRINVHFLSHYGDYAGSLLTSETSTSGETIMARHASPATLPRASKSRAAWCGRPPSTYGASSAGNSSPGPTRCWRNRPPQQPPAIS